MRLLNKFLSDRQRAWGKNCLLSHSSKLIFLYLIFCTFTGSLFSNTNITIVWSTENYDTSIDLPSSLDGDQTVPLSAGTQENGDGDLVELGYYSEGVYDQNDLSRAFAGDWIPLTLNTRIGDSSSGFGFDDGKFAFSTSFTQNSNSVVIFPTEPEVFSETLSFTITASAPVPGTPLCIRFYDSPVKTGSTKFNAVTGKDWKWPGFSSGTSVPANLYLKIHSGTVLSSSRWKFGATFEDPDNPFVATLSEQFQLGISVANSSAGMGQVVDNNGTYNSNSLVQISANPSEHYEFYQWTGGVFTNQWDPNTTVLLDTHLNIEAEFVPTIYTVSVPDNWIDHVEGHGPNDYGNSVSLLAYPPNGYEFSHWEENSDQISGGLSNPYVFTLDRDRTIVPVFTPKERDITINLTPGGNYVIYDKNGTQTDEFFQDQNYTIIFTPDAFFEFSDWSSASLSQGMIMPTDESPLKFILTVKDNASFDASFEAQENYLSIVGGVGTETLSPQSNMYLASSSIPVSATAKQGYSFDYWHDPQGILFDTTLAETEANISKIDVTAEITANFKVLEYNSSEIIISTNTGGTFILSSNSDGTFSHFSEYSLRAVPDDGYQFSHWAGDKNQSNLSNDPGYADNSLIVNGTITLEAVFTPSVYELTVSAIPEIAGSVTGGGGFTLENDLVVTANSNPYWEFSGWSGDTSFLVSPSSSNSIVQFASDADLRDINLNALFSKETYSFSAYSEDNGKVIYSISNGDHSHHSNSNKFSVSGGQSTTPFFTFSDQLGKVPDFDYVSLYRGETYIFTDNGVSSAHPFMIGESYGDLASSLVTGDPLNGDGHEITVTIPTDFDGDLYFFCTNHGGMIKQFKIQDAPIGANTASGQNEAQFDFEAENKITVDGVPDTGWKFKKWIGLPKENDTISYTLLDSYLEYAEFEPLTDVNLTAQFEKESYDLNISEEIVGGSTQGQGSYLFEEIVNIYAFASPHYEFVQWSGEDIELLKSPANVSANSLEIPARNISLTPLFKPKTYRLSLNSDDNGTLTFYSIWNDVNSTDPDINGTSTVVINATPNSGYILASLEWNKSDETVGVSYSNQFIIPSMDGNYSFTASFKEPPNDLNYSLINNFPFKGIVEDNSVKASLNQRTFRATSISNHSFLGWTFSDNPYPSPHWTSHEIDINVSEGMNIFAHFADTPRGTIIDFNSSRGLIDKQESDNSGKKEILFSASSSENFVFSHWENLKSFEYNVTRDFSSIDLSHSKLHINDLESPELKLARGYTYTFSCDLDITDKFYFSLSQDGNYTERMTSGITDTREDDNKVVFTVPENCPNTIFYNGSKSSFSGNKINIVDLNEEDLIATPTNNALRVAQDIDLTLVSHFSPVLLELEINRQGDGQILTSQTQDYRYGDSIELNAVPDEHWKFSHWESNAELLNPTHADINITLVKDTEISAVFEPVKYNLQITSYPESFGNAFSLSNKYVFEYGETVSLRALAKNGKNFVNWSGASVQNSNSAETTIIITGNSSLTARFEANQYTTDSTFVVKDKDNLVIEGENPGIIIGSSTAFDEEIVNFSYELEEGYEFLYWRDGDSNISLSSEPIISRKIFGNTSTEAVVRKLSYQVRVTTYPQNTGSVLWENNSYENFFEFTVNHGEAVNFTTEPKIGYQFKNWLSSTGNLPFPTSKSITFEASSDIQIAAYFEPVTDLVLNIIIEPLDAGWSVGSGTFQLNDAQPILAIPKDGWLFNKWIGNDINQTNLPATTINLYKETSVIAQFVQDPSYSPPDNDSGPDPSLNVLIVSTEKPDQGSTTGSGFYDDIWVNITATPSSNYIFSHWQGEGIENSLSENTRVYVDKDLEVTAHFEFVSDAEHSLFVTSNNEEFGLAYGSGTFKNSWASIRAVPNEGFTFAGWEGVGIIDLFSKETQIFVNSTKEAIAHFQRKSVFKDSTELGSEWWSNPWFGFYWKSPTSHWSYHSILGWIHVRNRADDSIWIWIDKLNGWFWTGKAHFPYLYFSNQEVVSWYWISLEKSSQNQLLIYKFGDSSGWQTH